MPTTCQSTALEQSAALPMNGDDAAQRVGVVRGIGAYPVSKSKGGRTSRQKGNRFERQLARLLQNHAFDAERVPLSGSAGGSYTGDFIVPLLGRDLRIEAKGKAKGFGTLYAWLRATTLWW